MKRYYISLIMLALGLTACDINVDLTGEEFLNRIPQSTISPDSYFRTETDLQLFSSNLLRPVRRRCVGSERAFW